MGNLCAAREKCKDKACPCYHPRDWGRFWKYGESFRLSYDGSSTCCSTVAESTSGSEESIAPFPFLSLTREPSREPSPRCAQGHLCCKGMACPLWHSDADRAFFNL